MGLSFNIASCNIHIQKYNYKKNKNKAPFNSFVRKTPNPVEHYFIRPGPAGKLARPINAFLSLMMSFLSYLLLK